jgi:hypothetical protein
LPVNNIIESLDFKESPEDLPLLEPGPLQAPQEEVLLDKSEIDLDLPSQFLSQLPSQLSRIRSQHQLQLLRSDQL